jgi:hypothetical protein
MKLDKSILDSTLEAIKAIDSKMTASAGNVSARKSEALEAIKVNEAAKLAELNVNSDPEFLDLEGTAESFPVHYLAVVEAELEDVKVRHEEAKQAVQDAIVAALKASKADTGAELATLRTERDELVNTAKAMGTLLKIEVEIPKAPKGSGSTSSSPRVAKSASGSHYVKAEDGTTSSYANDTFSGLAFYAFKRAGVNDLKSALSANGVTELTKPWETTVTVNGITRTIGHRVDEAPSTEG